MKRRKPKTRAPQRTIRLVGLDAPLAAAATAVAGLAAATALAAPGDLDPTFGDVGRYVSPAEVGFGDWRLQAALGLDDDDVLFGGGGETCYFSCYVSFFLGRLDGDGSLDPAFGPPVLPSNSTVNGIASQADGKVVGVGRQVTDTSKILVFRTLANGSADPDFGLLGVVQVSDPGGTSAEGRAISVDPDGRIVAAGAAGSKLLVARLLANGAPDPDFATGGVLTIDMGTLAYQTPIRILRTDGGDYRVMVTTASGVPACKIVAITAAGALDSTYGDAGIATASVGGAGSFSCFDAARQSGDRVVVSGNTPAKVAAAVRLLATGQQDPSFDAAAALSGFQGAPALAVDASGRLLVAPNREVDAEMRVLRLSSDGALDAAYGQGGAAIVDLPTGLWDAGRIRVLRALSGDRVLVGGDLAGSRKPFVARLLGSAPGGSPGVLGLRPEAVLGTEQQGQVVLRVRRTGGSAGAVAVNYASSAQSGSGVVALAGQDYTSTSGRLDWADGDRSDREIVVPILADSLAETPEFFRVTLSSPEGGAGLGLTVQEAEIAGAGYPAGQFEIRSPQPSVQEGLGVSFIVSRLYYAQGAVSVTLRVAAESTATPGSDFASPGSTNRWQDQVLTWADGETRDKVVLVSALRDKRGDSGETIVLELTSPTGGAVVGASSKATVAIVNNGAPNGGGSGGGAFGALGALLLGLAHAARRRFSRRPHGVVPNA